MKCTNWQVFGIGWSKKGSNIKLCQKNEIGLATLMKFAVVMETSTKDRDTIDISKFLQKVNVQVLNVSAPYSQSFYQNRPFYRYGGHFEFYCVK